MAATYTVRPGDTLTLIARRTGYPDWRTIYNAPENAEFRRKRPSPDRIFPGDVLVLPGRSPAAGPPTCTPPVQPPPPQATPVRLIGSHRTTQTPVRVTFDERSAIVKAGVRQFQWLALAQRQGTFADCLVVGFLQALLLNEIVGDYSAPNADPRPRRARVVLPSLPIRDHARKGQTGPADWAGTAKAFGHCSVADFDSPPPGVALPLTASEAPLSFGDDPGGRLPLNDPEFRDKLLRQVSIKHRFCTWIAFRSPRAPVDQVSSYTFLEHAIWTVDRAFNVAHRDTGPSGTFLRNDTKITAFGAGMGPETPLLKPPDANDNPRLVFS